MNVNVAALLAGTQVDISKVENSDYLISQAQYAAVVANMMKLTNNPGIAFELGKHVGLNDFGIVGYAMISAQSLREALGVSIKYTNSLVGRPIRIDKISKLSQGIEIKVFSPLSSDALHRFETEELVVRGMKMVKALTGQDTLNGTYSFSFPEPKHSQLYRELLKCPLEFDAPQTVIRILSPSLDTPIKSTNDELFKVCTTHCQNILQALGETSQLHGQLRSLFLSSPANLPTLEAASFALGMSVRTLCRELEATGQGYQAIKDQFRFDLSCEYLDSGQMPPKQVAYLLGFSSPSTFSRAFKSWSGKTVGQYIKAGS
jgi:AraC-like DNA-binding protein